jgi:phytoene desaturase
MQNKVPSGISGKTNNIAVIGSGFAGMAASAVLALNGQQVTVLEKNVQTGGRARTFSEARFRVRYGAQLVLDARCL